MSQAIKLHKLHVRGTDKGALVTNVRVFLCNLTFAVVKGANLQAKKVYINTRVLKHVYDKRPAQEYDFLLESMHEIIKYPEKIYENRDGKQGDYAFVKKVKNQACFFSIQVVESELEEERYCCEIVTFFRLPKESYLNKYKLLWSWEGDIPPS